MAAGPHDAVAAAMGEAIALHGDPITFVVRAVVRVHGEFALCF